MEKNFKMLKVPPCSGEGYEKVWARLRFKGTRGIPEIVVRLIKEKGPMAKDRPVSMVHPKENRGTIILHELKKIWRREKIFTRTGNSAILVLTDNSFVDAWDSNAPKGRYG